MIINKCCKEHFVVIGKEGSTNDGDGFIQRLWEDANSHFYEVEQLVKKDENGNVVGIWGAMSDMSYSFQPWEDGFTKGLYLAGVECVDTAEPPAGWTRWDIPGYEYIYIENEGGEVFAEVISYLQENDIELDLEENNEVIEPAKYTETMKAAHKEAVCKFAANSQLTQIVSSMNVTFDVEGTYKDYLDLIDYLQNYERATYIGNVEIPVTFTVSPSEDGKYYTESGEEVKVDAGVTGEVAVDYRDADILESKTISVTFFGVEQVEEIENLEINGVKIITNQNQ